MNIRTTNSFSPAQMASLAQPPLSATGVASKPALQQPAGGSESNDVTASFRQQFTSLAGDRNKFAALIERVFGKSHDAARAEQLRQATLSGDFSWLPKVRYMSDDDMRGAEGAYDNNSGTILLNERLRHDPELASKVFSEEAGHHLDNLLNKTDTKGDEGELFQRLLSGEKVSAEQETQIRNAQDAGTAVVDGKTVQVENFKKAFKKIGRAIKKGFKAVAKIAKPVFNVFNKIAPFLSIASWAIPGLGPIMTGITKFLGPAANLVNGGLSGALKSLIPGLGNGALGSLSGILNGKLGGLEKFLGPIAQKFGNLQTKLAGVLNAAPNGLNANAGGLLGKLPGLGKLNTKFEAIYQKLTDALGKGLGKFESFADRSKSLLNKLPTTLTDALKNKLTEWISPSNNQGQAGNLETHAARSLADQIWTMLFGVRAEDARALAAEQPRNR